MKQYLVILGTPALINLIITYFDVYIKVHYLLLIILFIIDMLFVLFTNKNVFCLHKFTLFAHDLKMYMVVNSVPRGLQEDFVHFSNWFVENRNNNCNIINVDKCTLISFNRRKNSHEYNYLIDKLEL